MIERLIINSAGELGVRVTKDLEEKTKDLEERGSINSWGVNPRV